MPTPASFAIASSGTSGPSLENVRTATSMSRSLFRRASARSGRSVTTGASRERNGVPSGYTDYRSILRYESTQTGNVVTDRITTPFTAESTAAGVIAGIALTGRRAVVTGGASGIGIETARALASAGAEVTLAVRNLEAGERTSAEIIDSTGNKEVLVAPLDLADQASVAAF